MKLSKWLLNPKHCLGTMTDALVQWQMPWYNDRCLGTMTDALVQWQMPWYNDRCLGTMTDALVQWQMPWYNDRCLGTMTDALVQWQMPWYNDRCLGTMTELKVQRKHAAGTSDLTSNCQNDFPTKHCLGTVIIIIIIIMYIYHALINALSAHMIHFNLNMTFYTHVKQS